MTNLQTYTTAALTADVDKRVISGLVLPFGEEGRTSLGRVTAGKGSVSLADTVIGNIGHDRNVPVGKVIASEEDEGGIQMSFSIANTTRGNDLLAEVAAGLRTGLSVEVENPIIRSGALMGGVITQVGFVTEPAFPSAQVASMTAADTGDLDEEPVAQEEETVQVDPEMTVSELAEQITEVEDEEDDNEAEEATTMENANGATAPATLAASADNRSNGSGSKIKMTAGEYFGRLAAAHQSGNKTMLAALEDVTQTGSGFDVTVPEFVGELWSGNTYERKYAPLVTNGTLNSYKVRGWRWVTAPAVAEYSGDLAAVTSNVVDTEAVEVAAVRLAGAHDIDRKFIDFGDAEFIASYYAALSDSYAKKSDQAVLAALVSGATTVSATDLASGINKGVGAIVDGIIAVSAVGDAAFALIATDLYKSMLLTPADEVSSLINLSMGAREGDALSIKLVHAPDLTSNKVLVGAKAAHTFYELGGSPIRVEALDVVNGGVSGGVFGYYANLTHDATGLAIVTADS